jgi:hypothetical protein
MTLDRESELSLVADAPAAVAFLRDRGGGLHEPLEDEPGVWWAQLRPAGDPEETYYARLGWSVYPGVPPSIKFAASLRGAITDPRAWPLAPGYRPTCLDVCKPISAEGFALHPDWAHTTHAWRGEGNPLLAVLRELQRDLNDPRYQGRFRG